MPSATLLGIDKALPCGTDASSRSSDGSSVPEAAARLIFAINKRFPVIRNLLPQSTRVGDTTPAVSDTEPCAAQRPRSAAQLIRSIHLTAMRDVSSSRRLPRLVALGLVLLLPSEVSSDAWMHGPGSRLRLSKVKNDAPRC